MSHIKQDLCVLLITSIIVVHGMAFYDALSTLPIFNVVIGTFSMIILYSFIALVVIHEMGAKQRIEDEDKKTKA